MSLGAFKNLQRTNLSLKKGNKRWETASAACLTAGVFAWWAASDSLVSTTVCDSLYLFSGKYSTGKCLHLTHVLELLKIMALIQYGHFALCKTSLNKTMWNALANLPILWTAVLQSRWYLMNSTTGGFSWIRLKIYLGHRWLWVKAMLIQKATNGIIQKFFLPNIAL